MSDLKPEDVTIVLGRRSRILYSVISSPIKGAVVSVIVSLTIVWLIHVIAGSPLGPTAISFTIPTAAILGFVMTHLTRMHINTIHKQMRELRRLNHELDLSAQIVARQTAQIQESEARYRSAIDGSGEVFVIVALTEENDQSDFRLVDLNPRAVEILHQPREALLGQSIEMVLPETMIEKFINRCRQVMDMGSAARFNCEGENVIWDCHFIPLGNSIAIRMEDITLRLQAEENMINLELEKQRSDLLRQFVSDTSHDLMTSITIARTSLHLLQKSPDSDRAERYNIQANQQIDRLQKMIQDMIIQVKLDNTQGTSINREATSLNTFLRTLFEKFEPVATAQAKTINLQLDDDLSLSLDQPHMYMAFSNLMENALNHTPRGTTITINTRLHNQEAVIEICDNGDGIDPDILPKIFERFYRAARHRPTIGGHGLGLSIARAVIEKHEGRIEAENAAGGGAVFRVFLPLHTAELISSPV
ncbi:MAG: PAS domain-containing sensor histidine kinase [Anaerolineae bacterium]|nr:PAS domain-containing sensor histidine kinase [Anaerolineae bacterium]